jgi:hypothetical protein
VALLSQAGAAISTHRIYGYPGTVKAADQLVEGTRVFEVQGTPADAGLVADLEGGGSGVTVDNGTDPPAAVTTLVAPGAVITGSSATLGVAAYQFDVQASDQVAVHDGLLAQAVFLFNLPAGSALIDARAFIREDASDGALQLDCVFDRGGPDINFFASFDAVAPAASNANFGTGVLWSTTRTVFIPIRAEADTEIYATWPDSATDGRATIIIFIANPA